MFQERRGRFCKDDFEIHFLITGVGPVFATYKLTKALSMNDFDFVLSFGIGGSFKESLKPGAVVYIKEEIFADIGVEENGAVKTLFESGLMDENEFLFSEGRLVNPEDNYTSQAMNELKRVKGITVNKASGSMETAGFFSEKYQAEVETMEGATVFYTCLMEKVRFAEIRAISNFVGDRNKANWKIDEALKNLTEVVFEILIQLINGGKR